MLFKSRKDVGFNTDSVIIVSIYEDYGVDCDGNTPYLITMSNDIEYVFSKKSGDRLIKIMKSVE